MSFYENRQTTANVAVVGLKNWSLELLGTADFDVTRGLIRTIYKLRDEISLRRTPFIIAQEFPEGYYDPTMKSTPEKEAQAWAHVYTSSIQCGR